MRGGLRIGKYVLDERIAVGGMAEVWAARAEGPQGFVKAVALKFILESFAGDPELERLFVNEARIAAQLQHANLVAVFDFDKVAPGDGADGAAGRYYIAMERVEGRDLRRLAEAARRTGYVFPVGLVLYLGGEVLKALRYVHERRAGGRALGLVHRDVSPHNVLVGTAGEVKLSDFGIAKTRAHSAHGTKTGNVRGKLAYASPEQLNGEPVDHRTDQFALGATLWEILAGRRLFDGQDDLETIARVVRCAVPRLSDSGAGRAVPPAVESMLRRMLAARRDDRFPTTSQALSALLALPGYSPDGAALGDLVRNLFLPSAIDLPPTMPIQAAVPEPIRLAATRTMRPPRTAPSDAKTDGPAQAAPPTPGSQALTRRQAVVPDGVGSKQTTVDVTGRGLWPRVALLASLVAVASLAAAAMSKRHRAHALWRALPAAPRDAPRAATGLPAPTVAADEPASPALRPPVPPAPLSPAAIAGPSPGSVLERRSRARRALLVDSAVAGRSPGVAPRAGPVAPVAPVAPPIKPPPLTQPSPPPAGASFPAAPAGHKRGPANNAAILE